MADREIGNVKIGMSDDYYKYIQNLFKGIATTLNPNLSLTKVGIIYSNSYRSINEVKEDIIDKLNTFPDIGIVADAYTSISAQGSTGILIYEESLGSWGIYNDISDLTIAEQSGIDPTSITDEMLDFSKINTVNVFPSSSVINLSLTMTEFFKIPRKDISGMYHGVSGLVFFNNNVAGKLTPLFFLNTYPFMDANDGLTINGKINLKD